MLIISISLLNTKIYLNNSSGKIAMFYVKKRVSCTRLKMLLRTLKWQALMESLSSINISRR